MDQASQNRFDYQSMIGVNLLWACSTSIPMGVLSLILQRKGLDARWIGLVIASNVVGAIIGSIVSGKLAVRYGPLKVVIAAILCASAALVSFEWTASHEYAALVSRVVQGFGFGMFLAAGIAYVNSKVSTPAEIRTVSGMFSVMAIAPYFFAQFVGQWYLDTYGPAWIFTIFTAPIVLALGVTFYLLPREAMKARPKGGSYLSVLKRPQVYPPYLCMMMNGVLFGLGASFIPIMLHASDILIGWYFTPYAVIAVLGRYFILPRQYIKDTSDEVVLAFGMAYLGVGCLIPIFDLSTVSMAISGALYGLAYVFIGPTVIANVTMRFEPPERPIPNALVQTWFQAGAFIAPILASYFFLWGGRFGLALFMSVIGLVSITLSGLMVVLATGPALVRKGA